MNNRPVFCPRPSCHARLENPRIGFCRDCGCVKPGSVLSQLLGDNAPRLVCRNPECGETVYPLQVGQGYPLFVKGLLNIPDKCPICECESPTLAAEFTFWRSLGYWCLPAVALVLLMLYKLPGSPLVAPESLFAAIARFAATPAFHGGTGLSPSAVLAHSWHDEKVFFGWAIKAFLLYIALPVAFLDCLQPRCQITRRASGQALGLKATGRVMKVLGLLLSGLYGPLVLLAWLSPNGSAVSLLGALSLGLVVAAYVGALLLLDFALPLVALAAYSVHSPLLVKLYRKIAKIWAAHPDRQAPRKYHHA